jgi:hypothetical protein
MCKRRGNTSQFLDLIPSAERWGFGTNFYYAITAEDLIALDHAPGAWIRQVSQSEVDRIQACLRRQFIHGRFDGEDISERPQGAQGRCPHRHGQQAVVGDPQVLEVIRRDGVTFRSTTGCQRCINGNPRCKAVTNFGGCQ